MRGMPHFQNAVTPVTKVIQPVEIQLELEVTEAPILPSLSVIFCHWASTILASDSEIQVFRLLPARLARVAIRW